MTDDTVAEFDLGDLETGDEATLAIKGRDGKPTTWLWTFYGPAHPKTLAAADRVSKKWLREAEAKEQAQVNGKKWKAEERSIDEISSENVRNIVDRLKEFTPVRLNGTLIEFSADAARQILLDPRKAAVLNQVTEFLKEQENFMKPLAKG